MIAPRTIRAIMRREFIDVFRDRRSLLLTFLYPITMLIMYGYGIRFDVDNVQLTVLDRSETPPSRALVLDLVSSGYFRLVHHAATERDVERDLMTDRARAAVIIPYDFADKLEIFRITPVPRAYIPGSARRVSKYAPRRCTAIT